MMVFGYAAMIGFLCITLQLLSEISLQVPDLVLKAGTLPRQIQLYCE